MTGFTSRTVRGRVAEVHGEAFPDVIAREVWFVEPIDAAVVLGSTQPLASLDLGEVARRGLGVVRRRSGGGAVVVEPASSFWFDVWLPSGDPAFDHDIGRSADWLGDLVVDALATLGVDGVVVRARDVVRNTPARSWARLVCFGATAAGEVLVQGRKAVGISQRRTRAGARFQVVIPGAFDPGATAALFSLSPSARAELARHLSDGVTAVAIERPVLRRAIEEALGER